MRYDSRNKPQAGQFRGVGMKGKTGYHTTKESRSNNHAQVERVPPLKY